MSGWERLGYTRNFYYRRFRAKLKQALMRNPLFIGWVKRRDERLRQQHLKNATIKSH